MEYASFSDGVMAEQHRSQHGGWFFIPEDNSEIIWFAPGFTPTMICRHRVTRGMNGQITCTL